MDDSISGSLLVIALLIAFDALITVAYGAFLNVRLSSINDMADEGRASAKRLLALLNAKNHLSMTYSITNTLVKFAIAVTAAVSFLMPALQPDASYSIAMSIALLGFIGLLTIILSDIVPEAIGTAYAEPLALFLSGLFRLMIFIFTPLTLVMLYISKVIANVFGSGDSVNTVTEEEIMTLVNAGNTGGTIEDEEKAMIYSVLQLDETIARELMTPRIDIISSDVNASLVEALDLFIESGFSRIPIYEENIDNVMGLLYAKDLLEAIRKGWLNSDRTVRDLARPAHFVPETMPADELLRDLQTRNVHMAIVVDEYGGTSGLVTIENLIEEIVGDIRDEYDTNEEADYIQLSEMDYLCDASMDLDDINDLFDLDIDTDEADTLGGYVYYMLGRVPDEGDIIEDEDFILTVAELDGRRIRKVKIALTPNEDTDQIVTLDPVQVDDASSRPGNDDEPREMADAS